MALYDAFISYSHALDKPVAAALQTVIQRLGKPWYRRRALRVFRDDTSLAATPELWPSIEQALADSRYLIVLASPELAASHWCGREVAYWLAHKSPGTLLVALTAGELAWDRTQQDFAWSEATPLPPALKGRLPGEPKWIDLRAHRGAPDARDPHLVDAGADLAAAIHGMPKEDLLSQELRQQRRAMRLAWSAAVALALLGSGAAWQWRQAESARRQALVQQQRAETERDRAQTNFGIALANIEAMLFDVTLKVTQTQGVPPQLSRDILDRAREMLDSLAKADPDNPFLQRSRAGMLTLFVNVYLSLGDVDKALEAANESVAIIRALHAMRPENPVWHSDLGISLEKLGDVYAAKDEPAQALAIYRESLAVRQELVRQRPTAHGVEQGIAVVLTRIGEVQLALGQHAEALAAFTEALAVRRKLLAEQPGDPWRQAALAETLFDLANAYTTMEKPAPALPLYEESAALDRALLDERDIADRATIRLGLSLERMGDARDRLGEKSAAVAAYEESLTVRRAAVARRPDLPEWRLHLVVALYKLATHSQPPRARMLLSEAIAIADQLAETGYLRDQQKEWPAIFRQALARLPANDG
ncbi:MAG: tetratricopeptide repeat protein [Variibacter sp.]|nr:tetratricopeptide repeat protein [Variibacter sp.]